VTATFAPNYQARTGGTPYTSLQTALGNAINGGKIDAMAYYFQEPILFDRPGIEVTIDGGMESVPADFSPSIGNFTRVKNKLTIKQGTLKIKGPLAVK
jgi:hypothetical protein